MNEASNFHDDGATQSVDEGRRRRGEGREASRNTHPLTAMVGRELTDWLTGTWVGWLAGLVGLASCVCV